VSFTFTEAVRQVLQLARIAARRYGAASVEPEHLVLALLTPTAGERLADVVRRRSDVDRIRRALIPRVEPLPDVVEGLVPDLPYSVEAKRMLEGALVECRRIGGRQSNQRITPLHLLAGAHYVPPWRRLLLRQRDTLAGAVLKSVGLDLATLRAELEERERPTSEHSAA
jgi:ATP-dependent Clp protease ATP-binding subunit ClpA